MFYIESDRLQYDRCIEYNILECFTFNPSDCVTIAVSNITFLDFVSAFGAAAILKSLLWNSSDLNIYISSVHVFVNKLLRNGFTDFDEIFCVSSGGFHNGLD